MNDPMLFLIVANILLCIYTTSSISIHLLLDNIGCFYDLAIVKGGWDDLGD